jgi:hypothetical protein
MQTLRSMDEPELPRIQLARPINRALRRRVKGYFLETQRWPLYLVAVACLAAIAGYASGHGVSLGLTAVMLLGIGVRFSVRPLGVASAAEVDAVMQSDFAAVQILALQRCQLEPGDLVHDQPCRFRHGLSSLTELGAAFQGERRGKDLKIRWTPHEITVVNFGRDQLFVYTCALDLTTGNAIYERTQEFFYRDIVSVDTASETDTIKLKDPELILYWQQRGAQIVSKTLQVDVHQSISLQLASGERIPLAVWDGYSALGMQPDEVGINGLASNQLRRTVRELKQHALRQHVPPRIVRHTTRNGA